MSGVEQRPEVEPPPEDRKAAPWAWPVIVASVLYIGWLVNMLPGSTDEAGEPAIADTRHSAELALLQIQSQAVIASASVDVAAAEDALETMKAQVDSIQARAALVLLEDFVGGTAFDPEGTVNGLLAEEGVPDWVDLVGVAVKEGVNEAEREELREELGWFAGLAAGSGKEAPEGAEEIRLRSTGVIGLILMCFLGAVTVILAGGFFLLFLIRRQRAEQGSFKFSHREFPRGIMLEVFALYLGLMALGELVSVWIHSGFSLIGYALSVIVPLMWPRIRGVSWASFTRSMGWHRGDGVFKEIGCGIVGYSGVLAIASMGIGLTWVLMIAAGLFIGDQPRAGSESVAPEPHPIVGWMFTGTLLERLMCLVLASVMAPLLEETFFRGALQRYFRGRLGFFLSALIIGLIFAGLHPQGWIAIPALGSIGIGFSLLREWRDSLIAPVVAHSINNGVLIVALWLVL